MAEMLLFRICSSIRYHFKHQLVIPLFEKCVFILTVFKIVVDTVVQTQDLKLAKQVTIT
jgi:hypothetical protein